MTNKFYMVQQKVFEVVNGVKQFSSWKTMTAADFGEKISSIMNYPKEFNTKGSARQAVKDLTAGEPPFNKKDDVSNYRIMRCETVQ
jgi:hypothetical protein